jgi:hypothetical protein
MLVCLEHSAKALTVAGAMGFHLVLEPLKVEELRQ